MSVISQNHSIVPFVSTGALRSKPFEGQRLAKAIYKSRNDKAAAFPNVCVSIPVVPTLWVTENVDALAPYVRSLIADTQDKIIRERYEAGATSVADEEIGIASVIAYLEEDSKSGRMTGDDIRAWFASELQDMIMVAIADKLSIGNEPSEADTKRIEQAVNVYRDKFASLAGGKTVLSEQVCEKLLTVLRLANDSEQAVTVKMVAKLEGMKQSHKEELLSL